MIEYLDTNIILRFLVKDSEDLFKKAGLIFRQAEDGKRNLRLLPIVVAEVTFVLESHYQLKREGIADVLQTFVSQKWIDIPERKALQRTWYWYNQNFHFVDSFLLASSEVYDGTVTTFDNKLSKKISHDKKANRNKKTG